MNKKHWVVASTGTIIYAMAFKNTLPLLMLHPETVSVIAKLPDVVYTRGGNYDIFTSADVTYGFIQADNNPLPDMTPILDRLDVTDNFVFDREQMLDFCQRAFKSNTSHVNTDIILEDAGKEGIRLYFKGMADELELETNIKAKKTGKKVVEKFSFLASQMITVLSAVSFEKVQFNRVGFDYFITSEEDPNYLGTIRMVQYNAEVKAQKKE